MAAIAAVWLCLAAAAAFSCWRPDSAPAFERLATDGPSMTTKYRLSPFCARSTAGSKPSGREELPRWASAAFVELELPAPIAIPPITRLVTTTTKANSNRRFIHLSLEDLIGHPRELCGHNISSMAPLTISGIDELRELIGKPIGPSDWIEVTQADIDKFAEISRDDQWIHVDVERAERESPFGTTIAHGNLTLSLIDGFRRELIRQEGVKLGINYGWNKVRFPAPVPAGSKVRATAEIQTVEELGEGWFHVVTKFVLEREGGEKPVCVAESVGRALAA